MMVLRWGQMMGSKGGLFCPGADDFLNLAATQASCRMLSPREGPGFPFSIGASITPSIYPYKPTCALRQRQACGFALNSFSFISALTRERKKPPRLCQQDHHPSRQLAKRV